MRHHHAPAPADSLPLGTVFLFLLAGIFLMLVLTRSCGDLAISMEPFAGSGR